MSEQDYKRTYGDDDDAAKLYREPEKEKCAYCLEDFDESDLTLLKSSNKKACDHCIKELNEYIIDTET